MDMRLDDNGLSKFLNKDLKKQLPYAQSLAINSMVFDSMSFLRTEVEKQLNTTRTFLKSSIQVEKATKKKLSGEVGFLDRVKFAETLIDGGTRTPNSSKYLAIPIGAKRNKKGGITKGQRPAAILKNKAYFFKEVKGTKFIFKRVGKRIKAMYVLKKRASYKKEPYFTFETSIETFLSSNDNYEKRLLKALDKAFKTRK